MSELKPCPFCGGEGYVREVTVASFLANESRAGYRVECLDNACCYSRIFVTVEKAIEAWNKRAETHEERAEMNIFDKETRVENCTVQILENTKTGRVSIGWWRNDEG